MTVAALLAAAASSCGSDSTSTADAGTPDGAIDEGTVFVDAGGNADGAVGGALFEPPEGRVYHGASPTPSVVDSYLLALGDPDIEPLIEGTHMGLPGTRPRFLERNVRWFLERVRGAGRVPHLSLSMTEGDGLPVDDEIAFDTTHDALIDAVAAIVAADGGPLFVRFGFEFNGPWNGYTPGVYPHAYRKMVDRFRAAGVVDAAYIWCYEPAAPGDFGSEVDGEPAWYPGDEYVDWFGLDLFDERHFDPEAAGSPGRETAYDRSVAFLKMATDHAKPVMLSETAAVRVYVTPDAADPDLVDGQNDWETWFALFFDFIVAHPRIKGFLYMNQDYRGTVYEERLGWGDARIGVNSYILTHYLDEMNTPRYIHREEGLLP